MPSASEQEEMHHQLSGHFAPLPQEVVSAVFFVLSMQLADDAHASASCSQIESSSSAQITCLILFLKLASIIQEREH